MSPHDPDRDLDDLLGDDRGRFGALYRRLPRYEPPRRLDRAVLGEAARAVHSGKPPRRQRWMVGVGSAAGLVLAAGIAWRIGHDAMKESDIGASAPIVVPVQPISEPARAKREQPAQPPASEIATDAARAADSSVQNAAASPPARDELKQSAGKVRTSSKRAAAEPPKPAPAPAAPPPEAFPAEKRAPAAAKDLEKSDAAGGAPAAGSMAAGALAPEKEKKSRADTDEERGLASPTTPSGSVELRRDMQLAPEEWLSHISQLRRQGRLQQATESLRLFVRAHPDWTIPDDLQPLLR